MRIHDRYGAGFIDQSKFHRAYAAKIMRDHIDGKRSNFLSARYDTFSQDYAGGIPGIKELHVYSAYDRIALGAYTPRGVLQRHRYTMWRTPEQIAEFFELGFKDYCSLYEIKDDEIKFFARLRWNGDA